MQKLITASLILGTSLIIGLNAQESISLSQRPMSLNDCIQLALEKNLTLKVERINPEISQASLKIS